MQCTNHFKQIGIATHNFHDTRGGIPPVMPCMYSGDGTAIEEDSGRISFWGIIYPFVEQQALYDKCTEGNSGVLGQGIDRHLKPAWWNGLGDTGKRGFGSVSFYRCPSRRGGSSYVDGNWSPGPTTDFAVLAVLDARGRCGGGSNDGRLLNNVWQPNVARSHRGPLRIADVTLEGGRLVSWQPRDTFAWLQDGTSNQIIVAEKHVPTFSLGKCRCESTSADDPQETRCFDCSYLSTSGETTLERADIAAHAFVVSPVNAGTSPAVDAGGRLIARSDAEKFADGGAGRWAFGNTSPVLGSAHAGVINVLLGDGSVRSVSKATNPTIVALLSIVDDGQSISLP
jgi:hypothetical protein